MRRILIVPDGWPCTLAECPPGPFIPVDGVPENLCFKSEYSDMPSDTQPRKFIHAYNSAGEFYHGEGMVQPVSVVVTDEEP